MCGPRLGPELTVAHLQVLEIVAGLIADVQANEPDTIGYEWYKSVDEAGGPRVTIIEKYVG